MSDTRDKMRNKMLEAIGLFEKIARVGRLAIGAEQSPNVDECYELAQELRATVAAPAEPVESHDLMCVYCIYGPTDANKPPCSKCYGGDRFEGRPVVFRDEEEADHE